MNKREVFTALVELGHENGYPPTIRQIAKKLYPNRPHNSLASSVFYTLATLVKDGLVERDRPGPRVGVYVPLCQPEDVDWEEKGDNGDGKDAAG